jgi:murein L,D-transpeptidase YafK
MRLLLFLAAALLAALYARSSARTPEPVPAFRASQQQFPKVRAAYAAYHAPTRALLRRSGIGPDRLELFLRAFKTSRRLEAWGRNQGQGQFVLLRTFRLAGTSGTLGPKRQAGDGQIPEGFYTVNRFNPDSKYHLSLGLDYPNAADQHRAGALDPGNDIFIHGSNETIGCLPITDEGIRELYVLAVEARAAGQTSLSVHIFPFELTADNLARRMTSPHLAFWQQLAPGYQSFEDTHELPPVTIDAAGRYTVR